ncbi:MAG: ribonuclease H, partial [Pseudomonadota bacterium]
GRHMRETTATKVSTDGSLYVVKKTRSRRNGPGGWAFVTHGNELAKSGRELNTTNNRMELQAVIEALKAHPRKSIIIRTDSQYVERVAKNKATASKNLDLWEEFETLAAGRKVRIAWVKGHSGDQHNETADKMARAEAKIAAMEASTD